jgi:hypothetical protein
VTPADVCNAIKFCDAVAHALPWGVIGAVVAALALTYGCFRSRSRLGSARSLHSFAILRLRRDRLQRE